MSFTDKEKIKLVNSILESKVKVSRDGEFLPLHRETIDLTTAKSKFDPLMVNSPFSFIMVVGATDNSANVQIKMGTRNEAQKPIDFYKYSKIDLEDNPQAQAFLHWDAQVGKTIDIIFILGGEFDLQSQSIENIIKDGTSFNQNTAVTVTTTATVLDNQDNDRNVLNIYNESGITVFIGDSAVTALDGYPIFPGQFSSIRNTAAIYGITASGSANIRVLMEK